MFDAATLAALWANLRARVRGRLGRLILVVVLLPHDAAAGGGGGSGAGGGYPPVQEDQLLRYSWHHLQQRRIVSLFPRGWARVGAAAVRQG